MTMRTVVRAARLRTLNLVWPIATLGRSTRVWVDENRYAELLAGAARAEALERENAELSATTERARAELASNEGDRFLADDFADHTKKS